MSLFIENISYLDFLHISSAEVIFIFKSSNKCDLRRERKQRWSQTVIYLNSRHIRRLQRKPLNTANLIYPSSWNAAC